MDEKEEVKVHRDAMGIPIEIGKQYGYSRRVNGYSTVILGEAISFSPSKVRLKILYRGRALYDDDITYDNSTTRANSVSVGSNSLFIIKDADSVLWLNKV